MNRVAYCPNCEKEVRYKEIETLSKELLENKEYTYNKRQAICNDCGLDLFVDEIHDNNLNLLYDVYRKVNGIIALDDLKAIPVKYAIGKRPLSLLLGWGEQTVTRYLEGKIPSKEYSDQLVMILEDPRYYNLILENNKDKIVKTAYERSKKTVLSLIDGLRDTEPTIDRIANYLIYKCTDLTPLALQKSLYYCEGFYAAFYKEYLFNETCQAWIHGPVYAHIYRKYKEFLYNPIEKSECYSDIMLTSSERLVADSVIKYISCYSGKILEEFTHSESPWLEARKNIPVDKSSENEISKDSIREYFTAVVNRYKMQDPSDIKKYASERFEKVFG